MKKFGATIRELREKQGMSLRKFAAAVDISPTYVSKIERDEFPPPGEERILTMAKILGQDSDWLLGLAGKVSSDLPAIVQKRPELMAAFLRKASKLSSDDVERLMKQMDKRQQ